ncbi:low affinity vacuolar monovalent cation/H(+) antiporter [[Candida] jaroonii]|uniref:Low affinity vacuolar monovalent cation/H(+) antiporter n=1 Tax=[Candida] jaroonii TaxID=467808 RepID=A0ACA9Y758_9ASCO|nr:low affinity vacuolar monovalent cation/H(+) antiporter [[Candida] jaroonii]
MPDSKKSPNLKPIESGGSRSTSIQGLNSSGSNNLKQKSSGKFKKRPNLNRLPSGQPKLLFSVDDDINDDISDEDYNKKDREYLEGYHAALKALLKKKKEDNGSYFPDTSMTSTPMEENIKHQLESAEESLKVLEDLDEDYGQANVVPTPQIESEDDALEDTESIKSSSSSQTIESLNLRERQDAINSTHPFGIKIWKPSLYKKKRSVAARAEEDIHETEHRPSGLNPWVYITNFIWSITLGLFLYLICCFCAVSLFVATGFGFRKDARSYIKLIYNLGKFWLFPFGKFVLLNKDENYIEEDDIYGSSINEFHRWRSEEEGRLFFAPPRRLTNSNESRPLIKDHKGRPLRDAYTFLNDENQEAVDHGHADDDENNDVNIKVRFFGRGNWTWPRIIFYIIFYGIMQPIFYFVGILCWLIVFTIPMSNITNLICAHLKRHPLALHFEDEKHYYSHQTEQRKRNQSILLCTYRCCGLHYYKYTIDGTNVFFINLLFAVIFVIFDFYILREQLGLEITLTDPGFLFLACLFSTIPLAFFIGQAVASISAQSSMGVGAFINAFFSTIVEIFLYCVALGQSKAKIVEGGMIGSVLAGVLLLPGLSMCSGALKRKTQRYNPRSAGVSSTMLLFGMLTMFTPSLFYQIYGSYEIKCKSADLSNDIKDYTKCRFIQPSFALDGLYYNIIQPFALTAAVALLLAYFCGIYFTLRSHASLIWATNQEHHKKDEMSLRSPSVASIDVGKKKMNLPSIDLKKSFAPLPSSSTLNIAKQRKSKDLNLNLSNPKDILKDVQKELLSPGRTTPVTPGKKDIKKEILHKNSIVEEDEEVGGHDAPNWSRSKSGIILIGATILYAVIAEILVDVVDDVLKSYPLNPKFLGLTVFALVPNTTEFINAISFAIGGNVALSMEIGSAYALQVVLIQIPVLAIYSTFTGYEDPLQLFPLVFPRWDIIATLISIYLFTYIYAEGKSNYFKGVILMLVYSVVLVGFYLNDSIEDFNDGYNYPSPPIFGMSH